MTNLQLEQLGELASNIAELLEDIRDPAEYSPRVANSAIKYMIEYLGVFGYEVRKEEDK